MDISSQISAKVPATYRYWFSYRFLIVCLSLYAYAIWQMTSLGIGFAMVCMVPKSQDATNSTTSGNLHWSELQQSTVLSSFVLGGIPFIIPAGILLDKFGCRRMILVVYSVVCLLTLLQPVTALQLGPWAMSATRILMGAVSTMQIPSTMKIVERWVAPNEFGLSLAFGYCGAGTGSLVLYFASGFLCETAVGWPMIFYFIGILMAIFVVLWTIFYSDNPEKNRFISKTERNYLVHMREPRRKNTAIERRKLKVPWKSILTSMPVLSGILASIYTNCVVVLVAFFLPQYVRDHLGFNIQQNGILSALPYFAQITFRFSAGVFSGKLQSRYGATFSIKLFHFISQMIPVGILVLITFIPVTQKGFTIFLFFFMSGCCSTNASSVYQAWSMMSGPFSGSVTSLGVMIVMSTLALYPYCFRALVPDGTLIQWHNSFYILAGFGFVCWLGFQMFGTSELQHWAVVTTGKGNGMKPSKSSARSLNKKYREEIFMINMGKYTSLM